MVDQILLFADQERARFLFFRISRWNLEEASGNLGKNTKIAPFGRSNTCRVFGLFIALGLSGL